MKSKTNLFRAVSTSFAAVAFMASDHRASAGILTWDSDSGTTGAHGGTGLWETNTSANWWDGVTNISAGTLKVGNATALGSSAGGVADGTVVSSGAVLDINFTKLGTNKPIPLRIPSLNS